MKRIYLSGPMTGIESLNFPALHAAAAHLRELDHTVVNPAELNPDGEKTWSDCLREDIKHLLTCEAIALLPNWEKSRGANLERHIAHALGMDIFLVHELEPA